MLYSRGSIFSMEESPLVRLDLRAPLEYTELPGLVPFDDTFPGDEASGELLFCFQLDREQASRIDPDADCFPGDLVFSGGSGGGRKKVLLPAGRYLFTQRRRLLNRGECAYLALEQQKDGLWEKMKPDNHLYIRFLFEDGSPVTQLFRPCIM